MSKQEKTYTVTGLVPVLHSGEVLQKGDTLQLTPKAAARLGAAVEPVAEPAKPEPKPSGKASKGEGKGASETEPNGGGQ